MQDTPATKKDILRLEGRIDALEIKTDHIAAAVVRTHERMDHHHEARLGRLESHGRP